jgi:hypothetical protein
MANILQIPKNSSKGGTDGQSLSIAVKSCIDKFHLRSKVISYTSDGGANLKRCKDYLNEIVSNDAIFNPTKLIFEQSCLAHALSSACKKAVIDAQTGNLSIEQTQIKLQKCITWTKSQKGCNSLREAQEFCYLPPSKIVDTCENKICILNICMLLPCFKGQKEGMHHRLPSKEDWEVARCLIETMKDVVVCITVNQTNLSHWLLSDAMVDFIHILTWICILMSKDIILTTRL